MSYIPNQVEYTGSYVPSTNIWDVQRLQEVDVNSPEFKELLVRLYQNVNLISVVLNTKDTAFYNTQAIATGAQWYNPNNADPNQYRVPLRKVINFGALPAAGSKSVAHGISFGSLPTSVVPVCFYGTAINPITGAWLSIGHAATSLAGMLQLTGDTTNVTITTGGTDYSGYTVCNIVAEWLPL